jgi:Ca-activated chloride channel family protein
MMFLWPELLVLLLILPLLIWFYQRATKSAARAVLMHPDLGLLARATRPHRWRHLLAGIYLGALFLAFLALARPTMMVATANPHSGIMLAIDTSRSMRTQDISPNRFEAARAALRNFVSNLPSGVRVGLVSFAGYATVLVPLTANHEQLLEAADRLYMSRGTAIGEGLLKSLEALTGLQQHVKTHTSTIILLSDGRNRSGIDPLEVLDDLKAQRVTVHTIGVGSSENIPMPSEDFGFGFASAFDEEMLRTIAQETGGRFVFVDSASELDNVYQQLGKSLGWQVKRDEATALASLAAALLLLFSLALSTFRRVVI